MESSGDISFSTIRFLKIQWQCPLFISLKLLLQLVPERSRTVVPMMRGRAMYAANSPKLSYQSTKNQ